MSEENDLWLLLAVGPAAATGLYWALYRYYRNTDKSHAFEHETEVQAKPVTGADEKIREIKGTRATGIPGDNKRAFRTRVQRIRRDSS
jgi:hypothetical protein